MAQAILTERDDDVGKRLQATRCRATGGVGRDVPSSREIAKSARRGEEEKIRQTRQKENCSAVDTGAFRRGEKVACVKRRRRLINKSRRHSFVRRARGARVSRRISRLLRRCQKNTRNDRNRSVSFHRNER